MRDRDLVRLYWPLELRPAFDALFDLDDAMGDVVMRASQPALAAIKLAWWRERLEGLDAGEVPVEPRLAAAARELLQRGIEGAELAELEAGWAALLQERPDAEAVLARGAKLFSLAAGLLQAADSEVLSSAGGIYVAGNLARRNVGSKDVAAPAPRFRISRPLRPLTGLVVLASRDLDRREPEGTPGRAWALLKHRLTGRI